MKVAFPLWHVVRQASSRCPLSWGSSESPCVSMFELQLRAGPLFPAVAAGARHSIIGVHGWTYMKGSFTDRETEAQRG